MRKWLAPASAVALAVAANLNILWNGFVYDDGSQILHNPWLRTSWRDVLHNPAFLGHIFSTNVWAFMGPEGVSNYYRPLMHLLNWICFQFFQLNATGYHAVSIVLHAACVWMVWVVTREIGFPALALWTALLFAVDPIHTESVAWIAANTELGYALALLCAFYLYMRGVRRWSAVLLFVGLLMKETTIVLIPLVAAWELGQARERGEVFSLRPLIPLWVFAIPLAIYFPLRVHALGGMTMASNQNILVPEQQLFSMFYLLGKYFAKLVEPIPFNIFYVFHPVASPRDPRFLLGLLAVAAMLAFGIALWKKHSRLWMAVVWIIVPLLPVLWIAHVGENTFTERYLYLPSIGYCWLAAWLITHAPRNIERIPLAPFLGAVLVAWFTFTTAARNADWHDDIFLYEKTLLTSPESTLIRGNLANAYLSGNAPERALVLFDQVAREKPLDPVVQVSYGTALIKVGRYAEARHAFERARALRPELAVPWYDLGLVSEMEGKRAEAKAEYRQAILRSPRHMESHQNLGVLLLEDGKYQEAELQFRAAASMASLGKLLMMIGRISEAESALRGAVNQDINNAEALYLLGNLLRDQGKQKEAEACFREMRRVLPWSNWKPPADAKF